MTHIFFAICLCLVEYRLHGEIDVKYGHTALALLMHVKYIVLGLLRTVYTPLEYG